MPNSEVEYIVSIHQIGLTETIIQIFIFCLLISTISYISATEN